MKFFIIGAGQWQVPAIKRAKELGYSVIVTDKNPEAPGFEFADVYSVIDTTDKEENYLFAKRNNVEGVMTAATDYAVPTVAYVSEKLGLSGPSLNSALLCNNKYQARKKLTEKKLSSIAYGRITSYEEADRLSEIIDWPVIIKPVDSCGSKQVMLTSNADEMKSAALNAMAASRIREAVYEEVICGKEFSVEGLVYNKKIFIAAITEKEVTAAPYFVEVGHIVPADIQNSTQEKIQLFIEKVVIAIGLDYSAFHIEIKISENSVNVVEIGCRLGGGTITSDLVPLATGIDLLGETIKMAIGETPVIKKRHDKCAIVRFFKTKDGILQGVSGIEEAYGIAGVEKIMLNAKKKSNVFSLKSSDDRIGYIICCRGKRAEAVACCEKAMDQIKIEIIK